MGEAVNDIAVQITAAMKSGDKVRLGTLRMLSAGVKNQQVEVGHELSDDEVQEIAVREAKKRKESIEAYEAADRADLVAIEQAELDVLDEWLPEQLSDDAVDALIDEVIAARGASGPGDMGKVMGQVMGRAKGMADGKVIQEKVKQRLGS